MRRNYDYPMKANAGKADVRNTTPESDLPLTTTECKQAFQNEDKAKRTAELVIANKELAFQNEEKAKRVAELVIANEEKAKRAAELVLSEIKAANAEKLKISLMETIAIARELVELRDPYTAGHEKHVGDLAKAIAAQMGFDDIRQE